MQYSICTLPGDGIGPEIVREARKVLEKIAELEDFSLKFTEKAFGGAAIDLYGEPLPEDTLEACKASEAVLMGSIGGKVGVSPWYSLPVEKRPEAGLLSLRKQLGLFCNLRPAKLYKELRDACPLKEEIIGDGFDIMMIRELTGGLYFGKRSITEENGEEVQRLLEGSQRGLDVQLKVINGRGSRLVLVLLPLTSGEGAQGYLVRIRQLFAERFGQGRDFDSLGIQTHQFLFEGGDERDALKHFLFNECALNDQQVAV